MTLYFKNAKATRVGVYQVWGACGRLFTMARQRDDSIAYCYCIRKEGHSPGIVKLSLFDQPFPICAGCMSHINNQLKNNRFKLKILGDYDVPGKPKCDPRPA